MTRDDEKVVPIGAPLATKLRPEHLEYFVARGIAPAYVKKMRAVSVADGILIPYHNIDGSLNVGFARTRLIPARFGAKFVQPRRSENRLYFPPLKTNAWIDAASVASIPLYSCEGECKAAALASRGVVAFAKGGVWNWRQDGKPVSDLDLIEWPGRDVRIVADSDAMTNPQVQIAAIGEYAEYRHRGAVPTIIVVPEINGEKTGVDDFIKAKGIAAFHDLPARTLDDPAFADWGLAKEPAATDVGNGARFVVHCADRVRYVHEWKAWVLWDGVRWRRDITEEVWEAAKQSVRGIYREAHTATDPNRRAALAKWAVSSESVARIDAMLRVARADRHVAISASDLDTHPHLLTVTNGVLDLESGRLLAARQEWLLTKQIPVAFDAKARCPKFLKFITDVMSGDRDLVRYIQRVFGYLLTGDTREQCFFVWWGAGENGKSTFMNVLVALLGEDFARRTRMETWIAQQRGAGGASEDIARLHGARMVSAVESEEEHRLAESLVKELTGQDRVSARFLYKESFEYVPQFKLIIVCNHKPLMRGDDAAMWRRVRLIPFERRFTPREQNKKLFDELRQELPGILNWALAGCLDWRAKGLVEPKVVTAATAEYRTSSDTLLSFFDDCCERDAKASVAFALLYRAYTEWSRRNGHRPMSATKMGRQLKDRGFTASKGGGTGRAYSGLRLNLAWTAVAAELRS